MQAAKVCGWITGMLLATSLLVAGAKEVADPRSLVFVTNRDSNDITIIDQETDRVIDRIPVGAWMNPHMAMVTPDGKRLVVAGTQQNRLIVIDLATRQIEKNIDVGRTPEHFDITPDSRYVYVGNFDDGAVSIVDLEELKEVRRLTGFFEPHGATVAHGGAKVYIPNMGAHEVGVINAKEKAVVARLAIGDAYRLAALNPDRYLSEISGIANVTLTPDERLAYAADGDSGKVAVIDTRTDRLVATVQVGKEPWRAYASPDGTKMLIPNNGDSTVSVIDTASQKVVATLKAGPEMTGVNFSAGGKKAYIISSASEESAVYVYSMENFQTVKRLKLGKQLKLETASTTADSAKIYLASSTDNSVYVIETEKDTVKQIPNVGESPWAVAILGGHNYCH